MSHKYSLPIDESPNLDDNSVEIARLWVNLKGPSTSFINTVTMSDPLWFGRLLADAAMNGARAYSQVQNIDEAEAMARIWEGLDLERVRRTGENAVEGSSEEKD
ncbi:DUF5076 domain-containing protein [Allosphingosinicella sp.]|jgi:hypothetical protein|uniref:DUF5076 domain-containing protein n=1 Tax=Allosphingosinicella sp. TaxID=2823234 RepID=UPI002F206778